MLTDGPAGSSAELGTAKLGAAAFIERMNEKALELGLESTSFVDPSGLNPDNVSSAYDLSRLISFAASDDRISPIMRTAEYQVSTNRRTFRSTAPTGWCAAGKSK